MRSGDWISDVFSSDLFELGQKTNKIYFGTMWRGRENKVTGVSPLADKVDALIRAGVSALYGLVELADDYSSGILRSQKEIRNACTHRSGERLVVKACVSMCRFRWSQYHSIKKQ